MIVLYVDLAAALDERGRSRAQASDIQIGDPEDAAIDRVAAAARAGRNREIEKASRDRAAILLRNGAGSVDPDVEVGIDVQGAGMDGQVAVAGITDGHVAADPVGIPQHR